MLDLATMLLPLLLAAVAMARRLPPSMSQDSEVAEPVLGQSELETPVVRNEATTDSTRPNIVVILADDQDLQLGSLQHMAGVKANIMEKGTTFQKHYCTIALCCPSRVNLWTGLAAHNTNVTDLAPPWGGYPKFVAQGLDQTWLPTLLQNAGYNTYYTGKLMNAHTITNYNSPYANGFTGHDYLLEPGTYQYWNSTYQHNTDDPVSYPGLYNVEILQNRSLAWLDEAAQSKAPFFLTIAPAAPHASLLWNDSLSGGPMPEPKYMDLFTELQAPRTANFNPDKASGASWLLDLETLNETQIAYGDEWYRNRTRVLQSIDAMVNATVAKLSSMGVLDNTYIIYTSDNGYHIGNHRLQPGKRCPYEEDINVPLIVRGPGIPAGSVQDSLVTTHTDLTPTMLKWAGVRPPSDLDGLPIPTSGQTPALPQAQNWEHAAVEHWGTGQGEGIYTQVYTTTNNTYKALRLIGPTYSLYYSVWCDGSHELYDMQRDAQQMENLYGTSTSLLGVSLKALEARLDALVLVLKTCAGKTCTQPWTALHPDGDVNSLPQALDKTYDTFYEDRQHQVAYQACMPGYLTEYEMPLTYVTYGGNVSDGKIGTVQPRDAMWEMNAMWDEWIMWM